MQPSTCRMCRTLVKDAHNKAVSCLVSRCRNLAVVCVLAYGSYARGDYKPDSDIDLLVVLDSEQYTSDDLQSVVEACKLCGNQFHVKLEADTILDSEIDLWNKGILLEGHSFIDLAFYKKDGKVLLGTDVRKRFKIPDDLKEKAKVLLGIIEAEFKRWFLEGKERKRFVPHWMTGWLLVTFLNTQGVADVSSFNETCRLIEKIPFVAVTPEFKKYKEEKELTPDEFINLYRAIKSKTI